MKTFKNLLVFIVALIPPSFSFGADVLYYTMPASERKVTNPWMEYQLPIGNGQIGAMIQGGVWNDEIQFNEKTLWTGSTSVRGAYQNFGYVTIEDLSSKTSYTDYKLQLDLSTAIASASWKVNGVDYQRDYLASYPSHCIVIHTTVGRGGLLNLRFSLRGTHGEKVTYRNDEAVFGKQIDLLTDACCLKISQEGGTMTSDNSGIMVTNAHRMMAVLVAGTDYDITSSTYTSGTEMIGPKMQTIARETIDRGWEEIYEEHVNDYAYYYNKVSLDLGGDEATIPTDQLIDNYQKSNDPLLKRKLEKLYFDYGRYLLISSSRGVPLPNNLQGIWCNSNTPSWTCDIHANINVQMNYWPAEITALSDMHLPLLDYVYCEAMLQPQWRRYAREINGQTVGWSCFTGNNIFGFGSPGHSEDYNAAPAWYCWHLWQHYLYTNDEDFLKQKALPPMIECVRFWMQRLVMDDEDHTWVCPLEWSPEHGPSEDGTAHTQQCVWNLFDIFLQAVEKVGEEYAGGYGFISQVRTKFAQLDKGLHTEVYTGKYGKVYNDVKQGELLLREWKNTTYDVGNVKDGSGAREQNHRHVSHLMCLYPFDMVTPSSEYFEPVIHSMKLRGEQNTGWAMAWKLNLWARAGDGNKAFEILTTALQHARTYQVSTDPWNSGVYYNLLDAHPPFQIDGNFGVTAGIAEMLLQSYGGVLQLLPSLPDEWKSGGVVRGLRTMGNYGVDIEWGVDGMQTTIRSESGLPCKVKYPHVSQSILEDEDGNSIAFQSITADMILFPTEKGKAYRLSTGTMGVDQHEMAEYEDDAYYLLNGVKVEHPTHGIYIHRGKKVVFH
ncbi:MAG: glycoside hydrolase N-terminal domain-containing protein [Prevotella sp.]|nr:glycoside hydrolase N-terminal domain-containing protein [Prevotella sp.]